jgi:hypothetical protein
MADKKTKKIVAAKSAKTTKPATKVVEKVIIREVAPTPQANVLRWKAPDYYTFERSPYWSLVVGIVSVVLASILILTNNYFPVIIIILAVIVSFQVAHDKPKTQEFAIDESGVLVRNTYLTFAELRSFWIAKHGQKSVLYIEPTGLLKGPIMMPLGQQNENEIKYFLLRFLPEKFEAGEMMSEKLIRIFKL